MTQAVEFSAEFTKLTLAAKNKIELVLPEGLNFARIAEIASHKGQHVHVVFGNPQMAMNIQAQPNGRSVATINSRGEVEGFTPASEANSEDSDADDVFVQEGDAEEDGEQQAADFDDPNHDPEPEGDENQDPEPDVDLAADEESAEPNAKVELQELEKYIITERPSFEDLPYDFPAIVEKKNNDGLKWWELTSAFGLNVTSTKLQSLYGEYKKRVRKMLRSGAA